MMYTNFGRVWIKGAYNLQISPPPDNFSARSFQIIVLSFRFLIRTQIFNLIRGLEGDENYVERNHHRSFSNLNILTKIT